MDYVQSMAQTHRQTQRRTSRPIGRLSEHAIVILRIIFSKESVHLICCFIPGEEILGEF